MLLLHFVLEGLSDVPQEFWKSVSIWQSWRQKYSCIFFETWCI